jgi:hypothetical protein
MAACFFQGVTYGRTDWCVKFLFRKIVRASGQDRCLEVTDETIAAGNETEGEESCRSNYPLGNIRIPPKRKALNG